MTQRILFFVSALAVVFAGCSSPAAQPSEAVAPATVPTLAVEIDDFSFRAPASVSAGWTRVVGTNLGAELHHAAFYRLVDGKGVADLVAHFESGASGVPAWAVPAGGPNAIPPTGTMEATIELTEGLYAIVCVIPGSDHVIHAAKGMVQALVVAPAVGSTAPAPEAGATLDLADFSFSFVEAPKAGEQVIRVVNKGPHAHEAVLFQLVGNATTQDLLAWLGAPEGMPPGIPLGGTTSMDVGGEAFFPVTFEQGGRFTLLCFDSDGTEHGEPHFVVGMVNEFEVA